MDNNDFIRLLNSLNNKSNSELTGNDLSVNSDFMRSLREAEKQSWSVNNDIAKKYNEYGLNYTPIGVANGSLDRQRAEAQSGWEKFGRALGQTVVSEIGLGTAKAFTDLIDLVGSIFTGNGDYSNPASAYLEQLQDEYKANHEIYMRDPNAHIGTGGMSDWGWWCSNIPSIASSLTLLIPGMGVAKGVSAITKLEKVASFNRKAARVLTGAERTLAKGKDLTKFQAYINSEGFATTAGRLLESGVSATVMRAAENYQEARQTYNDMFAQGLETLNSLDDKTYNDFVNRNRQLLQDKRVDPNNKEAVAKAIAEEAADRTFKIDWSNVVFDAVQMYSLAGIWRKGANARYNAKVARANKDAAKYLGKTKAEIDAIKAQEKWYKRLGEHTVDFGKNAGFLALTEANEAIEEAINYIAQQEGINYGRTLIGVDKEGNAYKNGTFSDRLHDYMLNPELWDSAFWGLMGGVVFAGVGGGLNRLTTNLLEKNNEVDKNIKDKLSIWDQLPEVKRQLSEINSRQVKFKNFFDNWNKIVNDNIDVFNSTKNNTVTFSAEDTKAKEAAKTRLLNELVDDMTISAMNNGTLNLFKSFIEDPNLRQAMIDNGYVSKEDADSFMTQLKNHVEDFERKYANQIVLVNAASAELKGTIPMEYLQLIAANNVKYERLANYLEINKQSNDARIAELKTLLSDKLDPNINYDRDLKISTYSNELGKLRARLRILYQQPDSLENAIAIRDIKQQIKIYEDKLDDQELMLTTWQSLRIFQDNSGKLAIGDTQESLDYFNKHINVEHVTSGDINKDIKHLSNFISERAMTTFDKNFKGMFDVLNQNVNKGHLDLNTLKSINELKDISSELHQRLVDDSILSINIDINNGRKATTKSEVKQQLEDIHKRLTKARDEALKIATDTLTELRNKNKDEVEQIIGAYINGEELNADDYSLSSAEFNSLKDALDVLQLDKPYNEDLLQSIAQAFIIEDAIQAAQDRANRVGNANNNQQAGQPQNGQQGNPSSTDNQAGNGQNSNQNGQNGTPIDKQRIDNRQAETYNNISHLPSGKFWIGRNMAANDPDATNAAALYKNDDDTYTLDIRKKYYVANDEDLFDNLNPIDTTKPFEVVVYPIIRRNGVDSFEVVSKGQLKQTSDSQNSSTGEGEQAPPSNPSPAPTPEPTRPAGSTEKTDDVIDGSFYKEDAIEEFKTSSLGQLGRAYKNDNNVDLDALSIKIIDDAVRNGLPREDVERIVNKNLKLIKARINKSKNNVMQSTIAELLIEQSENNELTNDYKLAAKGLVNIISNLLPKINGKVYISFEDLLRYINNHEDIQDSTIASQFYDSLRKYLDSDEARQSIILTDKNNKVETLKNVQKTIEERIEEKLNEDQSHRVDIDSIANELSDEEKIKFYQAFDKLQPNEELFSKVIDGYIYLKTKDGVIIGGFPIPTLKGDTYIMYNKGWRVDVTPMHGVSSELKEIFKQWLEEDNEINKIITQLAFDPTANKKQLYKDLLDIPEFAQILNSSFVKKGYDIKELADHLASLWRYTKSITGFDAEIRNQIIQNSLDNWFTKLYNSYDSINELANGKPIKINVSNINEGEIERIENAAKDAPSVKSGIAPSVLPNVKLAIKLNVNDTNFQSSDGTQLSAEGYGSTTIITFPKRNGTLQYVAVYGAPMSSGELEGAFKEINDAVKSKLKELVKNYKDSPIDENYKRLERFVYKTFSNGKNSNNNNSINSSLYYADFNNPKCNLSTFLNNIKNKENIDNILNGFFENIIIRMNREYVLSDSMLNKTMNGICTKKNGKFIVTIDDKTWEFDSYNDMMIQGNAFRVNTKVNPTTGTNYKPSSANQFANRVLEVKFSTSTPVEEIHESSIGAPLPIQDSVQTRVLNVLNSKERNKGLAIATIAFEGNEDLLNSLKKLNVLPKNIIFDAEFNNKAGNEDANAEVNKTTHQVTVGQKWIDKFNNPLTRSEAIRKLIHEEIHYLLSAKRGNVRNIREIYDEFRSFFENGQDNEVYKAWREKLGYTKEQADNYFKTYFFDKYKNKDRRLEEFLVESLTSSNLAEMLNMIEAKDYKLNKSRNLFQKLLEALAKLFNWNVREGSLYEKELATLQNIYKQEETTSVDNNQQEVIEEPKQEETSNTEETPNTEETYGGIDAIEDLDFNSTIDEIYQSTVDEIRISAPNSTNLISRLPLDIQPRMRQMLDDGEVSMSCR